jgi:hypothetical protein
MEVRNYFWAAQKRLAILHALDMRSRAVVYVSGEIADGSYRFVL